MKSALILVDIQNDYFPGGRMQLVGIQNASLKAKALLAKFRASNWPRFHIQHLSVRRNATFFLPGTEGVKIHPSIEPHSNERVIQKHYPNSFRETQLLEELKKQQIGGVVICGAMSHMCIDATTRAAFDFGFNCTVIQDACATCNLEFADQTISAELVHASFMAALASAYARVLDLNEFINGMAS